MRAPRSTASANGDNGAVARTETPPAPPARPPLRSRVSTLATPWWVGVLITVLLFTTACWTVLAPWQFRRHHDRDAQNASVAEALATAPAPVDTYLPVGSPPSADEIWRRVTVTGTFLPGDQVYARLRANTQGYPAAEVVLPLRLTDGTVLLVDRGYVPDADVRAGRVPVAPPAGPITVTGRVQADQPDPLGRAPVVENGLIQVYGVDSGRLAGLGGPVRPGFIQLVAGSPGVLAPIGVPDADTGPFLSYAWQWCAFGAMALLAVGYFMWRQVTDPPDAVDEDGPGGGDRSGGVGPGATDPGPAGDFDGRQPVPSGARPIDRRPGRKAFDRAELYD